jgi:dephospho-CoA kinase
MKVIGLTGNIGCGKTTVAGMLRDAGVVTIDADAVAREIRHNDADARAEIERRFGTYEADELARIVFSDAGALRDLERILHPRVRGAVRARLAELAEGGVDVASVEAIKLIESPLAAACDAVWVVRCDEGDAIARLAASRRMDEATARSRLASQSPQEAKVAAVPERCPHPPARQRSMPSATPVVAKPIAPTCLQTRSGARHDRAMRRRTPVYGPSAGRPRSRSWSRRRTAQG